MFHMRFFLVRGMRSRLRGESLRRARRVRFEVRRALFFRVLFPCLGGVYHDVQQHFLPIRVLPKRQVRAWDRGRGLRLSWTGLRGVQLGLRPVHRVTRVLHLPFPGGTLRPVRLYNMPERVLRRERTLHHDGGGPGLWP